MQKKKKEKKRIVQVTKRGAVTKKRIRKHTAKAQAPEKMESKKNCSLVTPVCQPLILPPAVKLFAT